MKPTELFFRDVTHDPEASQTAIQRGPELRAALLACGFTPSGLAEFRAPGAAAPMELLAITNPDAALIREAVVNGEVDEVMVSPDRRALAAIENAFGGPVVSIRTLLEDGRIVETTMKPNRGPQNLDPLTNILTGTTLPMQATTRLMRLGAGKMPLWPRGDWPRAGYRVELIDTRDVVVLWQRHRQRLSDLDSLQPLEIRPHTSVSLYFCFSCRTNEVQRHQAKWIGYLHAAILAVFLMTLPLLLIALTDFTRALKNSFGASAREAALLFLVPIGVMLMIAIAAMVLMGLSRTLANAWIRGPRLRPVPDLLTEVQQHLTATPPPPPVLTERQQQALDNFKRRQEQLLNPRPPSRVMTIVQLIFIGGMMGALVSTPALATSGQVLLKTLIINVITCGLIAIFWNSRLRLKIRLAAGVGLGVLLSLIYQLFLYPLGRPWSLILTVVLGIIGWAVIDWLWQLRTNKPQLKE